MILPHPNPSPVPWGGATGRCKFCGDTPHPGRASLHPFKNFPGPSITLVAELVLISVEDIL